MAVVNHLRTRHTLGGDKLTARIVFPHFTQFLSRLFDRDIPRMYDDPKRVLQLEVVPEDRAKKCD